MSTDNPTATHRAEGVKSVGCAILTLSDTRTIEDDRSGAAIRAALESAGHAVHFYRVIKDERSEMLAAIDELKSRSEVEAVMVTGGTGISPRDQTPEVFEELFEKRLEGFGELFRMLSYEEIGAAAMLSRATAGTWVGRIVFVMPGSTAAVRLAMEKLILPELGHAVGLLKPKS